MDSFNHKIWSERYRLAALSSSELLRIGLVSVIAGLLFTIFHFQGNNNEVDNLGRSAFLWLQFRWETSGGDFSHGWLIPFISAAIIWWKRAELADAKKTQSELGLAAFVLALFLHYIGAKAQQPRLSVMALIVLIWSIPFYLYGWRVARILSFPAAFLIFCIPLNFLDSLTFPLRIMVTIITSGILNGLGIEVARSGSMITAVNGSFNFNIDDPCSGLRSLIALTAITAVYSYVTMRTFIRKWLLFAASIPIAVIGNICRILTIGLVAQSFGQKVATGLYHDYSGYIFFPVAMSLMLVAGWLFNLDFKQVWVAFKKQMKQDRDLHAATKETNLPSEGL